MEVSFICSRKQITKIKTPLTNCKLLTNFHIIRLNQVHLSRGRQSNKLYHIKLNQEHSRWVKISGTAPYRKACSYKITPSIMKVSFIRVVASPVKDNLLVFYYLSASEIWPYKRVRLWHNGPYKRDLDFGIMGLI